MRLLVIACSLLLAGCGVQAGTLNVAVENTSLTPTGSAPAADPSPEPASAVSATLAALFDMPESDLRTACAVADQISFLRTTAYRSRLFCASSFQNLLCPVFPGARLER